MTSSPDRNPFADQLLGRLADFLRLRAIYPANNQRVQGAGREFSQLVADQARGPQVIRIRFAGDTAKIDGHAIPLDRPITRWVADTFRRVSLEGLDLSGGIDGATLEQFAVELQRCATGTPQPLASRWPAEQTLLRPIPLVIRGHHVAGARPAGPRAEPGTEGSGEHGAERVDELLARLATEPRISERIAKLQSAIDNQFGTGGEREEIDLLDRIVELVGESKDIDQAQVATLIDQVLDGFDQRIVTSLGQSADTIDPAISEVARRVAGRFFARSDAVVQSNENELPSGRPEDERVTDDLAELVADLQKLPWEPVPPRFESEAEVMRHALSVCTNLLAAPLLDATPTHAASRVGAILSAMPTLDVSALDPVLAGSSVGSSVDRARVLRAFQDAKQVPVLFRRRCLDDATIAGIFPQWFPEWLDSLDPALAEDAASVRRCLEALPVAQFEAGCRDLVRSREFVDPGRIRRLTALGGRFSGRLLAALCAAGIHEAVQAALDMLRETDLPSIAALALRVLPPGFLPKDHVVALCRLAGGDTAGAERLKGDSAALIRRFVQESEGDAQNAERRLRAIRALAHVPSPQSRALLSDLARGWPFGSGERKEIRRAASDALRDMERGGRGCA